MPPISLILFIHSATVASSVPCSCKQVWKCDQETIQGCPSSPCDGDVLGGWCEAETLPCDRSIPDSLQESVSSAWPALLVDEYYRQFDSPSSFLSYLSEQDTDFFYCVPNESIELPSNCGQVKEYYKQGLCCGEPDSLLLGKKCSEWKQTYRQESCCSAPSGNEFTISF